MEGVIQSETDLPPNSSVPFSSIERFSVIVLVLQPLPVLVLSHRSHHCHFQQQAADFSRKAMINPPLDLPSPTWHADKVGNELMNIVEQL